MIHNCKEYIYFEDIFNEGLAIAQDEKRRGNEAADFWREYIEWILDDADDVKTIEEARNRAEQNFGYYAGYFGDDTRQLIRDTYGAIHPIFGDKYNIAPTEAFIAGKNWAREHRTKYFD